MRAAAAMLGSLAVHGALIAWLAAPPAAPTVTFSLAASGGLEARPSPPATPTDTAASPPMLAPATPAARPRPVLPAPGPARAAPARGERAPTASVATVDDPGAATTIAPAVTAESAGGSAAAAPTAAAAPAVPAAAPASPAPDAIAVRAAVADAIRYPRAARAQGLQGTVAVRFRIAPGGAAEELEVVVSAGAILDAAAVDAVRRAAPFASPPGWVRVPVIFSLHDTP
jgi:protein TonB